MIGSRPITSPELLLTARPIESVSTPTRRDAVPMFFGRCPATFDDAQCQLDAGHQNHASPTHKIIHPTHCEWT